MAFHLICTFDFLTFCVLMQQIDYFMFLILPTDYVIATVYPSVCQGGDDKILVTSWIAIWNQEYSKRFFIIAK